MKSKKSKNASVSIALVWENKPSDGEIKIVNGTLGKLGISKGGKTSEGAFAFCNVSPFRLEITIDDAKTGKGAFPTIVEVSTKENPFSFLVRDVNATNPIYIAEYSVVVTACDDKRGYAKIRSSIASRGLVSDFARFEMEPEESYEQACARNRDQYCPTWLGLGRDMRIFRIGHKEPFGFWGNIEPVYHSRPVMLPGADNRPCQINFCLGPGSACRVDITRWLEDGCLPILHSTQREGDVLYNLTAFATLETKPVSLKAIRGTDWRAAYPHTGGNMLPAEEKEKIKDLITDETVDREEEVVCVVRTEIINTGKVPRLAFVKGLHAVGSSYNNGLSVFDKDNVIGINLLDAESMPQEEMAILLQPGEKTVLDLLVPHNPIPQHRATALAKLSIERHLEACRSYWQSKLDSASRFSVPEKAIDERIKAGLLHCDIAALGLEPDGDILATIGWYSPIGSESSPIIQFFDSMGWHKLAERSLDFFLDRQREDGFIQNFANYQLETGPVLWTMGEHYRHTHDDAWVGRVKSKILKACEFLLAWRERNKRDELKEPGCYGLLDGKVADPNDFVHSFYLNGLTYLGLQRASEMLAKVDPKESKRLAKESAAYKEDIRNSFYLTMARAPVIPVGDGSWAPYIPSWAGRRGGTALFVDGANWFTHGAFTSRCDLIGPMTLVISEILDPQEVGSTMLLKSHQTPFTVENAVLSQPYYCRHDLVHLKRGEVKAFLKTFYNQLTGLQDRETYTFWEHYWHASQHKTHEEGWFLMQCRWMLYMEDGEIMNLLAGIPRAWVEDGKIIRVDRASSHFGLFSLQVESTIEKDGRIEVDIEFFEKRRPKTINLRLPHPLNLKAKKTNIGHYDPARETVRIDDLKAKTNLIVEF